ncbi:hypothetical protein HK097_000711 [Rhizophlyctis rosea]|uniref:Tyrosine specific protein phosphatases domain-containing protein n=1 Tax=Rhizophlyctis rosea TaxID=64517 RepID=A0AAD5X194_9FUNG|nr:hypothetical protein HK097_000711 [Rhizophlyctis rosea]
MTDTLSPTTPLPNHGAEATVITPGLTAPKEIPDLHGQPVPLVLRKEDQPVEGVFQNVCNFRDVGSVVNKGVDKKYLKPRNFFRSGRLDDATTEDLKLLAEKYSIKTVIDLRSELEGRMGEQLTNTFPASAIAEHLRIAELAAIPSEHPPVEHHREKLAAAGVDGKVVEGRYTYYINFAGKKFRKYSVWKPLSLGTKLKAIGLMIAHQKPKVVEMVGKEVIGPRGLIGLNKDFVDYCGDEIAQALTLLANPSNFPVLVHCTQGKDRTGLIIAFTLSMCDVPRDVILHDYDLTNEGLLPQRDVMVEEMRKTGLDSSFSDAPPEVLKQLFEYVEGKWGSVDGYLDSIGVKEDLRLKIRKNVLGGDAVAGAA